MTAHAGVREHRIGRDKFHHKWDNSLEPVAVIDPGDVVHFETEEVTAGEVQKGRPAPRQGTPDLQPAQPPGGPAVQPRGAPGDPLTGEVLGLQTRPGGWGAVRAAMGRV